ncbi:MAG: NUDIX domain-containing protein [Candidatus Dojkabacteria bacterium]
MRILNFGQKIDGKQQSVYVIIYTLEFYPWSHYPNMPRNAIELNVPVALLISRYDGKMGFAGGGIEQGESLYEGLKREAYEEINTDLETHKDNLESIVTIETERKVIHLFGLEVNFKELLHIQKNSVEAQHFGNEISGTIMVHLHDYPEERGLITVLKSQFSQAVAEGLLYFLRKKMLYSTSHLVYLGKKAGLDIDHFFQTELNH